MADPTGTVNEPGDPLLAEPLPPARGHVDADPDPGRDVHVLHAVCSQQHDPSPNHRDMRRGPRPGPFLEDCTVLTRQPDNERRPTRHGNLSNTQGSDYPKFTPLYLSAAALAGCSSDSDGAARGCLRHGGRERHRTGPRRQRCGRTGDGATGYGDLCDAKQQTGDALLDAAGDSSDAIDEGDVDAVRAAYVAYYDAYQADVDAMVELFRAISDDPTAPEEVVAGAEEAIEAGGELFDETVARARSGLESADSIEEIVEVFNEFNNDLRGTPPDFKPQLLPPVIVSWGMEPNTACNNS